MTARSSIVAALLLSASLAASAGEPAHQSIGGHVDDAVITAKVKSAYFNDPAISIFDVKVETFKGRVQLSGFVDNPAEVERAAALARAVPGVKSVDNAIRLKRE